MNVSDLDLEQFNSVIKASSNYDFSEYSEKSIKRRLAKLLVDNKTDMQSMLGELRKNKDFLEKTVRDITVNTTELFRDPQIWHMLRYKILPRFAANNSINIWHAGCSTGQEVYSMLILLSEMGLYEKAKVFASDINSDVLAVAAKGIYKYRFNIAYLDNFDKVIRENPYNYEEHFDVPYEKYMEIDKVKDIMRMKPFLLEKPIFRKHDLVKDNNIFTTRFDLVICRNVIIYFNYELQNRVFNLFRENLFEKGCLVLGMHETILGTHTTNFEKKDMAYYRIR
jgi:chemotaxis protein methyltransferase CheR